MKDIKIKKYKPSFTGVVITLDCYEEDLVINGVIVAPAGTLRPYQKVIAVGDTVRNTKPGDLVRVNFENYAQRKYRDNSIKEDIEKLEDTIVYNIPKILIDDTIYGDFQDRDIKGVIEEYDEIEVQTSTSGNKLL